MEYYKILNLSSEPFANTPDPEFFYRSKQHVACLQKIEISLRLKRGLNVITGEVGTGKTTLCRQLIRVFAECPEFMTFLILDPGFRGPREFLTEVARLFRLGLPEAGADDFELKEAVKNFLFKKGVEEGRTTVLIIDEGQKIPDFALEILREFLNYETNDNKLLQIVIFAQNEFQDNLKKFHNFSDRISLFHRLGRLNFRDAREMVNFRIRQAGRNGPPSVKFTWPAIWSIYRASGGRPRGIINLCHSCVLAVIIQNKSRVTWSMARACLKRVPDLRPAPDRGGIPVLPVVLLVLLAAAGALWLLENGRPGFFSFKAGEPAAVVSVGGKATVAPPGTVAPPTMVETKPAPVAPPLLDRAREAAAAAVNPPAPLASNGPASPAWDSTGEEKPPDLLGRVTLKPGDKAGEVVKAVAGVGDAVFWRRFKELNPAIGELTELTAGRTFEIPAISMTSGKWPARSWWVELGRFQGIEDSLTLFRLLMNQGVAVRIIPFWSPDLGLQFAVVLAGFFQEEDLARRQVEKLPRSAAILARPVVFEADRTVFFADPFLQAP
ncbi:MAG: AAA family ATPase [Pseudomonadota bacterium]